MNIRLHNTLTRQKEVFMPADPQRVTMYVCGPTVYNYVHIGNARPVVVFDMLNRLLSRHYPQVIYARNITDVDDKINAAAAANGEPIRMLAERYAAAYREDMAQLNALPPTIEPWATEHIPQMIALIERLITRRCAMPSYVLAYRYKDKLYRAVVHGQDASLILGDTPTSVFKVLLVVAGALLAVVLGIVILALILGS